MPSHRKGATGRNYASEYAERKLRGLSRGLSLKQLRGHPKSREESVSALREAGIIGGGTRNASTLLAKKYAAIARMSQGESLSQAARHEDISLSTLRRFAKERGIAQPLYRRKNGKPTSVKGYRIEASGSTPILVNDGTLILGPYVDSQTASLLGRYWNDVDNALNAKSSSLGRYDHTTIHTLDGTSYHLMTDVNAIRAFFAALTTADYTNFARNFYSGGSVLYESA